MVQLKPQERLGQLAVEWMRPAAFAIGAIVAFEFLSRTTSLVLAKLPVDDRMSVDRNNSGRRD